MSRSLAACEGALLVVDAAQGVEAQTLANTYLAIENGLEVIPVLNKVDLPAADPDRVAPEVSDVIGVNPDEVLRISAKTGEGVAELLEAIVHRLPPPTGKPDAPARALIFDSEFDPYRGVIAYVRMMDGKFRKNGHILAMQNGTEAELDDIGFFRPVMTPVKEIDTGEVGYVITGIKDVARLRVGDTLTDRDKPADEPPRATATSSRWSSAGCSRSTQSATRTCVTRLTRWGLNDAALSWEPETSDALGFGFRCGFLGLLHMEIVRERLERGTDSSCWRPARPYATKCT